MTDGGHDIGSGKKRTAQDSANDFENVVRWAAENDVCMYTIALQDSTGRDYDTSELKSAASRTGGEFLQTNRAEDLPTFFNTIFATQIDSTVITAQGVRDESLGENWYTVNIPIPNSSVLEANIMVGHDQPKGKYVPATALFTPDGKELTPNRKDSFQFETDNFSVYKVVKPASGMWKLQYYSEDTSAVDINIIYSYNLTAKASVSETVIGKTGKLCRLFSLRD